MGTNVLKTYLTISIQADLWCDLGRGGNIISSRLLWTTYETLSKKTKEELGSSSWIGRALG